MSASVKHCVRHFEYQIYKNRGELGESSKTKMAAASSRVVFVRNLGRMGYLDALRIQKAQARQHLDFKKDKTSIRPRNILFLCEHNPVYTIGIRNKTFDEREKNKLKKLGAEFYTTDRGGLITFHGPGQLVCYPVLDLGDFKKSIRWYVRSLEEVLIDTCGRYGIDAGVTDDTGVWIEDRKIAAIGKI